MYNAAMADAQERALTFLVTRLQNIGDTLVWIPALRALRRAFPMAHIIYLGKHAGGQAVMQKCPYIDQTISVEGRGLKEKLRLLRAFRRCHIDWFIISPQDLGRVPWAVMGGARHTAGFSRVFTHEKWRREKWIACMTIRETYDQTKTETENCLDLVRRVIEHCGGDTSVCDDMRLEYSWYGSAAHESVQRLLSTVGVDGAKPYIVSAPFSKREAKNWPVERWRTLFQRLFDQWQMPIIVIGGEAERAACTACASLAGVTSLAGDTSLEESAAIIAGARLFVGPDSGPAFIATAVDTPAVALYGPADYARWRVAAPGNTRIELHHTFPCAPCRYQVCLRTERCMDSFTVEEVETACNTLLKRITDERDTTE